MAKDFVGATIALIAAGAILISFATLKVSSDFDDAFLSEKD